MCRCQMSTSVAGADGKGQDGRLQRAAVRADPRRGPGGGGGGRRVQDQPAGDGDGKPSGGRPPRRPRRRRPHGGEQRALVRRRARGRARREGAGGRAVRPAAAAGGGARRGADGGDAAPACRVLALARARQCQLTIKEETLVSQYLPECVAHVRGCSNLLEIYFLFIPSLFFPII
jgi:hypothetical protein